MVTSTEFQTKLGEVMEKFSKLELIAIANLLAIEINQAEHDTANYILNSLTDLKSFTNSIKIVIVLENVNSLIKICTEENLSKKIISFTDFENLISSFCRLHTENIINGLTHNKFGKIIHTYRGSETYICGTCFERFSTIICAK